MNRYGLATEVFWASTDCRLKLEFGGLMADMKKTRLQSAVHSVFLPAPVHREK